jgi:Zn-dependent protease
MATYTSLFYFIVLIISIMVHEVAHGIVAEREGDPTARLLGRITLNPLKHIDLVGSIILPLILLLSGTGMMIGWAKPVPYNPERLRRGNKSIALVASAGIIANIIIAVFFGLLIRFSVALQFTSVSFISIASIIVLVNIVLALFNAVPLAPLDGFNILSSILPRSAYRTLGYIERFSLPLLLMFVIFGWQFVAPLGIKLYTIMTGLAL